MKFPLNLIWALAFPVFASTNVFVLQQPNQNGQVSIFSANPLTGLSTISASVDPAFVLTTPSGAITYVLGKGGTVVTLDAFAGFSELSRYSLSAQITAASITPDGKKLLVLAGQLRVIDLTADPRVPPSSIPSIDVGTLPDDLSISLDSSKAYVTSSSSRVFSVVDLNTNQALAQQILVGTPHGVTVAPNGLVYVAASNHLYEIDGQNGITYTVPGGITFSAEPGKPFFTPDGLRAVMLNTQATIINAVIAVDLKTRAVSMVNAPVSLKNLVVASESTAYAVGNGTVYQFNIAPLQSPTPANIGFPAGVLSIAGSDESPDLRFLFGQTSNNIYRFDRVSQALAGPLTTISDSASVVFNGTPSNLAIATLRPTMLDVTVAPNSLSFPISICAVDTNGRPVAGALVTYSAISSGVTIQTLTVPTNSQGLAATRASMPAVAGNYTVRASGSSGGQVDIVVRVASQGSTTSLFTIAGGQGQIVMAGGPAQQAFVVMLRDPQGAPVSNATVNWTLQSGSPEATLQATSSATDANGIARNQISTLAFSAEPSKQFVPFSIQASVSTGAFVGSQNFAGVLYPNSATPPSIQLTTSLLATNGEFVLPAGATIQSAFRVITNTANSSLPITPIPNVGIRISTQDTALSFVNCSNNSLTNPSGIGVCDLTVGPNIGSAIMNVAVGELPTYTFQYPIRIIPGAPAQVKVVQGDGQSGAPGTITPQALVIQVLDAQNNPLRDVAVNWTVVTGDGSLVGPRSSTDLDGRASTQLQFGSAPGTITVRAQVGSLTAVFTLTNTASVGGFVLISGNNQSSSVNTPFAIPLAVKVSNANGAPVVGVEVSFSVTIGSITLSDTTGTTDDQGIASVIATAGSDIGSGVVQARLGAVSVTFSLVVTATGPRVDSVLNGASFRESVAACSVAIVKGAGFTQGLSGVFSSGGGVIPTLAYSLKGVSVQVNGIGAPLFYISNIDGVEQIGIQIPCELANGANTVSVTALGTTATKAINVLEVAPGVFETEFTPGVKQGVVVKADGSYVSPTNPAAQGETLTGFFTGLMPTSQPRITNAVGVGQPADTSRIIIGLNNAGMPVVSAQYAPNMIGVYTVKFVVDPSAGSGDKQAYAIGVVDASGSTIYGNSSTLPIR